MRASCLGSRRACAAAVTRILCAGIAQAALSYGKVFVLDNLGDLYQLTAAGTVVAGARRTASNRTLNALQSRRDCSISHPTNSPKIFRIVLSKGT